MDKVILTRLGRYAIISYVSMVAMVMSCKRDGLIQKCGDIEVLRKIVSSAGIKMEGHEVKVVGDLCIHRIIYGGRVLPVYYAGGKYFVGVAMDEEGNVIDPFKEEKR